MFCRNTSICCISDSVWVCESFNVTNSVNVIYMYVYMAKFFHYLPATLSDDKIKMFIQSINQSVSQSINQPINPNQPTNQLSNQSAYQSYQIEALFIQRAVNLEMPQWYLFRTKQPSQCGMWPDIAIIRVFAILVNSLQWSWSSSNCRWHMWAAHRHMEWASY